MSLHPLVVDLDGTLIYTDMLHESVLKLLHNNPLSIFLIFYWLLQGKAELKKRLAQRVDFDPSSLPYNRALIDWLKQQRSTDRRLILCTASDVRVATVISEYVGIFDEVMASDHSLNLKGKHKAEALVERFGRAGFDYVGNSRADVEVWQCAQKAVIVNAPNSLVKQVEACCVVEKNFPSMAFNLAAWIRALRVHQWLKNLLLFVPVSAAHQLSNAEIWPVLITAFFAFSLCASSVYVTNDLLDLESDRQHPSKNTRPFASGLVPVGTGVISGLLLLFGGLLLAWQVGGTFLPWLLFYFALTCAYSYGLKRLVLVDCLTLAMLYTIRIVAGAAAVSMPLSFWLLAFSVFLFLSLAFVKRYAEFETQMSHGKQKIQGRGYVTSDAPLIQTMGITSGYAAVVVLALYLNSDTVVTLYRMPELIWGVVPVVLFWVSWMWMQAYRGKMNDDPLIFAIKDKASLLAGLIFAVVLVLGAIGLPW